MSTFEQGNKKAARKGKMTCKFVYFLGFKHKKSITFVEHDNKNFISTQLFPY